MKHKGLVVTLAMLMFFVGGIGGIFAFTYFTLPYNEELIASADTYYSKSDSSDTVAVATGVQQAEEGAVSVHFLELGNKYTGDCTYIKVGENIDILIDCGSKSNSISTVSEYLNQYVTDGILEYVIITHAHQDHYAGFATTPKIDSIFDLYECKNIIYFALTNQKSQRYGTSTKYTMYDYFLDELDAEIANGATAYTALDVLNNENFTYNETNGVIVLDEVNEITLQILNSYYYTNKATTENDYSVCTLINQGDKHFIFTGDLEENGEEKLVNMNSLPQVELYKAGHHGSKTSSSVTLLDVIQPKIVCVCCCAGSSEYTKTEANQFPTKQFIENVSRYTTKVYVTTLCVDYANDKFTSFNGNIVVMAKKGDAEMTVYCSNNTIPLKDTDWFKDNRYEMCKDAFNYNDISRQWLKTA